VSAASSSRFSAARRRGRSQRAQQRSFPVIGLLSSRPPFSRIEPAAESARRSL